MAINLWKIGVGQTSFNPLANAAVLFTKVNIRTSYVLTFSARSISGNGKIFHADGVTFIPSLNNAQKLPLTTTMTKYSYEFTAINDKLYLWSDTINDIIIQDIQLVQKPLPKLTINGIDGFTSGKWQLHANARVVDDETLELNATGASQLSYVQLNNLLPSTVYTMSVPNSPRTNIVFFNQSNGVVQEFISSEDTLTFTSPSSFAYALFRCTNASDGVGTFTFKRPMLNLGTTPAPYERKKGERMVLPVVKGNVFSGSLESGTYNGIGVKLTFANAVRSVNKEPIKPNTDYSMTIVDNNVDLIQFYDSSGAFISFSNAIQNKKTGSFKTPNNCYFYAFSLLGTSLTDKVMINEGTTAQPYTPYAVQVNKKPKRYVPKKNLFDGQLESGTIATANGANVVDGTMIRSINYIPVNPSRNYIASNDKAYSNMNTIFYDVNKNFISFTSGLLSFVTPSNCMYVRFRFVGVDLTAKVQIEEGTTATPYEPYQQVLPRAKTGITFNGVSDYLQLPSMTMDSIEIDCLIDGANTSKFFIEARNGLANGYYWVSGSGNDQLGSGFSQVLVNGSVVPSNAPNVVPRNQRVKIKVVSGSPFTDDISILGNGGAQAKGTLYKVICYLAGQVVAQYDFENPANLVGDKVFEKANNLIPSFEDARWQLHANADVLGKDVLRLENVSGTAICLLNYSIPVTPLSYVLAKIEGSGRLRIARSDNNSPLSGLFNGLTVIQIPSGVTSLNVQVDNNGVTGTFDFIKPQLYELSGKEGTLVGKPTPLRKASKRSLYAKR